MSSEICVLLKHIAEPHCVIDIDAWIENTEQRELDQAQESIAEIIPNLFLGDSSVAQNRDELLRRGIKRIVNVSVDLPTPFEDLAYLRVPIDDKLSSTIKRYFQETFEFIDAGLTAREGVLVHCFAGISRSPTIVCAYLMKKYALPYQTAFEAVRSKRCIVDPNFAFCIQLMTYEKEIAIARND